MTIGKKTRERLEEKFSIAKPVAELTQGMMIKILREKNELSQNELSKLTGLNQSTISGLENDRIRLGIERAKVLARAFKVHPAVLAFPDWKSNLVA